MRHKNNVKNGAYAIFQHRITFEPLIQFSKNESVLESAPY